MSKTFETIQVTYDDRGVATLTLNRPEKHNALNDVLINDLRVAAEMLGQNDDVRIVVLTGEGKSFCAGGDINWFASNIDKTREERVWGSSELARMLHDLNTLPKTLIGRINGPAYGGGVGMVSVCDLTVGTTKARFGLTEVRLGLIPANISPYVVERMGVANSRATMLSGALFSGTRAHELNLLTHVVEPEELDNKIEEVLCEHLEAAPGAVAETKKLISYVSSHSITDSMIYTADRLADAWETQEGQTGVSTFLNKQTPPWRSKS